MAVNVFNDSVESDEDEKEGEGKEEAEREFPEIR